MKQRRRETAQYWDELIEAVGDFTLAESPEMYARNNRPECPRCETICQEVVYGFPVAPPAKGEEGKFHYAGCITNFWPPGRERWWCPGCNVFIDGSALRP